MTRNRAISASTIGLSLLLAACGSGDAKRSHGGGDSGPGGDGGATESLFADRTPDRSETLQGPAGRIDIARDELGIPHIYAGSVADGAFAIGYMHASDRLLQMDLFRHNVMGRLSEYFGAALADTDVAARSIMMTRDGKLVWDAIVDALEPDLLESLKAYSAGVNAVLAEMRRGDRPMPPGYDNPLTGTLVPDDIPDWTPADTIAVARLQQQQLSETSGEDIARGELMQTLSPEMFADLARIQPADPTVILPEFYDSPDFQPQSFALPPGGGNMMTFVEAHKARLGGLPLSGVLARRARDDIFGWERLMPWDIRGSNNWVLGPEHTESGFPMVFNDPHLFFAIPPLFYHSHMNTRYYGGEGADTGSIAGISFPGIPTTLIGHNEYVAWGATVVGWDVSDVYIEQLNADGTAVMFNGEWVDLLEVPIEIAVSDGDPVSATVEIVPHHGPIQPGSKSGDRALSIRWTGQEVTQVGKANLLAMRAKNIDDWMSAMELFDVGAQNWNGADVNGNIGYAPFALVPRRKSVTGACNPTMPVDGTGPCEWEGFLSPGEIPHAKNRDKGYVVTANNDVTGTLQDNDPTNDRQYLHSSRAVGFRAGRITERVEELIDAGGGITLKQMQTLQADTKSLEAERLVPFLLSAADAQADAVQNLGLEDAIARLEGWDFTMPSGVDASYRKDGGPSDAEIQASIAAAIYNAFYTEVISLTFADDLDPLGVSLPGSRELLYLLENPTESATGLSLFDDAATDTVVETPDDIMLRALSAAVAFLEGKLGTDPNEWRWGKIHQIQIQDLFGQFGFAQRTLGPFPRHGGNYTVDVANAGRDDAGDYIYRAGPQMRFFAVLDPDGIHSGSSLPGGQIDDPDGPHYDDLLQGWLRNETFDYYFTDAEVRDHVEELIVIEPAD